MKKFIALIILVTITCTACAPSSSLKRISNTVMTDEFKNSIEGIYSNEDDVESLFIPSFGSDKSILKTLAVYNLCNTRYSGTLEFEADCNAYRCSVEASLHSGENEVMVSLLTNEATEEEYYEAYRVASIIKDEDLLASINRRYENYNRVDSGTLSNRVYRFLNERYLLMSISENDGKLADDVIEYIKSYVEAEYLDTTFEVLSNLTASVAFLQETDIHSEDNLLEELYHYYADESNQRVMIFEPDVIFEYYCRILGVLRSHLSIKDCEDFFTQLVKKEINLYTSLSYDIMTAKNFTMYVISLSYTDISMSKEHLSLLKKMHQQIAGEIELNDYLSIFYLNMASEYLGTDKIQVPVNKEDNSIAYLWATNQKREFDELNIPNADIVQFLMICSASHESEQRSKLLKEINIFDYMDEEGFSQILNLYVCVMSNSDFLTHEQKSNIDEYITNAECIFGYREHNGGYDFRASVYYTNIKYILGGGEDIGLR